MFYSKHRLIFLTYLFVVHPNLHFSTSTFLNIDTGAMAENNKQSLDINYNDLRKAQSDDSILIIDVREKEEIDETGKLPGSIHIPSVF